MFHAAKHALAGEAGIPKVHVDKYQDLEQQYHGRALSFPEIFEVASRILLYHPYVDNNGRISMLYALKLYEVSFCSFFLHS
jgi:hypothetical protein